MQTGSKFGMQTMDAALVELVREGAISREEAEKRSSNPDELGRLLGVPSDALGGSTATGSGRPTTRRCGGRIKREALFAGIYL
jgi:hypothetical protein